MISIISSARIINDSPNLFRDFTSYEYSYHTVKIELSLTESSEYLTETASISLKLIYV